jgi:hypothetical protein
MAYPKRTETEKQTLVAKVLLLLKSKGMEKEYQRLEAIVDLDGRYNSAMTYNRNMGYTFEDTMYSSQPQNDFDIVTASTENADADVTSLKTQQAHEHMRCPMSKSPYKRSSVATANKLSKERRKMLMEKHVELLDWIQCVDDGIVKDNVNEARRMVNLLNDYADKLDALIREKFHNRAVTLWKQFQEITASMQDEEIEEIKREVKELAPQYAR